MKKYKVKENFNFTITRNMIYDIGDNIDLIVRMDDGEYKYFDNGKTNIFKYDLLFDYYGIIENYGIEFKKGEIYNETDLKKVNSFEYYGKEKGCHLMDKFHNKFIELENENKGNNNKHTNYINNMCNNSKKCQLYLKDKDELYNKFYNEKDNNNFYLDSVRLIYNTFITNHSLIDGNKRMFKREMEELNILVSYESLE